MDLGLIPGLLLLVTTLLIALGLGWYAWRSPSLPGLSAFVAIVSLVAFWSFAGVGELTASTLAGKLAWANTRNFAVAFLPLAWLALALDYTGRRAWLTVRYLALLCVVPLATQVLLWTDGHHHLMRATVWLDTTGAYPAIAQTFGQWFWIQLIYSYALIAFAAALLIGAAISAPSYYRRQPVALLIGSLIPMVWNLAHILYPALVSSVDFTPSVIALAGVIAGWGLFRVRLFNLVPVARHLLVENMADGVLVLDQAGKVVDLNRAAQTLVGRPAASILAKPLTDSWEAWSRMVASHAAVLPEEGELCLDDDAHRRFEVKCSPLVRHDQEVGSLVVIRDITERALMEESLRRQALSDSLTGLPNRTLFMMNLADAIRQARRRSDALFAVMVLDIDRFKLINDSIGHLAGDVLLRSVAAKLKRCVREVDSVARMGGDEFMILLHEISTARDLVPVLERIRDELRAPVYFRQQEITAAASVGVVIWDPSYDDPEDLLRAADTAMYQAKEAGRDCHRIFDEEMHKSVMRTLNAETDLRAAIRQRDFSLAYQPVVDLGTGRISSLEALIRWHHPQRGTVLPDEFISVAENSGLILTLGEMALEELCSQMSLWRSLGGSAGDLPVSLNVSPRQLTVPEFATLVLNCLSGSSIPSDRLIIEVTESAFVRDPATSKQVMRNLRQMGIRLCLDDFGTGASSLQHLTSFPVQELKIHQTFVSKISPANTDLEVVRSLTALAHTLGLDVTAEGIESSEQWRLLQEVGCDRGQGYYVGSPMEPPELLRYLEDVERGSCSLPGLSDTRRDEPELSDHHRTRRGQTVHWRPQVSLATKHTP